MTIDDRDLAMHRAALSRAASLANSERGSRDRRNWWLMVHGLLTQHSHAGNGKCADSECGEQWPCSAVHGAIKDMDSGSLGW